MDIISDDDFMKIVNKVAPPFEELRSDIWKLKNENKKKNNQFLAADFGKKQARKYASVGAAAAAPGVFPGLGTLAQVAVEIGSTSIELSLMLRWMASGFYSVGLIYGKNVEDNFKQEFYKVLGIWSGVLTVTEDMQQEGYLADKGKEMSISMLKMIAKRVLKSYVTRKFKKGLGRLVPFGVGAAFGATTNYQTMFGFMEACHTYFRDTGKTKIIEI